MVRGYREAKIALRLMRAGKSLAVIYKEATRDDGFVVTAYFTTKLRLEKEEVLWQKQQ